MRTRSPSRAPPKNGEDESTFRTPMLLPRSRNAPTRALVDVDLPTPGLPVMPMTWARPECGASAAMTSRSAGCASSTSEMSRATARGEPALAASTRAGPSTGRDALRGLSVRDGTALAGGSGLRDADDQGVALATATAQGGGADPTAAALELERQVQGEAGAGHADRVPQRDGATVDVDDLGVDAELLGGGKAHGGERLVDLDEVEVGGGEALLGAGGGDGARRLALQRGVGTGDDTVGTDLGEPGQAQLLRLGLAHHDHGGGAVGDLRGGPGRDRAVLAEGRTEPPQALRGGVRPDPLVGPELDRVALALRDRDRHDLVVEEAVLPRLRGELVAARGVLVLLVPGELQVALVGLLGQQAHRLVGEGVPQPVEGHVVAHAHVAVLEPLAALLEQVRGVGHGLLPTGHDDLELAGADELVGQGDRVEAGQADLVDGQRRDAHRDARLGGRLAGRDLAGARLQHLAHDHVVDLVAADAGLVQGALDRDTAEVGTREALQRTEQAAHRGPRTGDDD